MCVFCLAIMPIAYIVSLSGGSNVWPYQESREVPISANCRKPQTEGQSCLTDHRYHWSYGLASGKGSDRNPDTISFLVFGKSFAHCLGKSDVSATAKKIGSALILKGYGGSWG